jgi:hypothetical protein
VVEQLNQTVTKIVPELLKENTNILKKTLSPLSQDFSYSLAQKISSWCPVSHP